MRIVPAVDIRGGLCVNLVQGDFAQETVYSQDPVDQAQAWWDALLEAGQKEDSLIHISPMKWEGAYAPWKQWNRFWKPVPHG